MHRGARQAAVYRVAKSGTWLSDFHILNTATSEFVDSESFFSDDFRIFLYKINVIAK